MKRSYVIGFFLVVQSILGPVSKAAFGVENANILNIHIPGLSSGTDSGFFQSTSTTQKSELSFADMKVLFQPQIYMPSGQTLASLVKRARAFASPWTGSFSVESTPNLQNHWSEAYYWHLVESGVTPVYSQQIDYNAVVTRRQLAYLAVALREYLEDFYFYAPDRPTLPVISDVSSEDPLYHVFVKAMHDDLLYTPRNHIEYGKVISAELMPDEPTSRAQTLQTIIRSLHLGATGIPHQLNFVDIERSSWMEPYFNMAAKYHLLPRMCDAPCEVYPDSKITQGELFYIASQALAIIQGGVGH